MIQLVWSWPWCQNGFSFAWNRLYQCDLNGRAGWQNQSIWIYHQRRTSWDYWPAGQSHEPGPGWIREVQEGVQDEPGTELRALAWLKWVPGPWAGMEETAGSLSRNRQGGLLVVSRALQGHSRLLMKGSSNGQSLIPVVLLCKTLPLTCMYGLQYMCVREHVYLWVLSGNKHRSPREEEWFF